MTIPDIDLRRAKVMADYKYDHLAPDAWSSLSVGEKDTFLGMAAALRESEEEPPKPASFDWTLYTGDDIQPVLQALDMKPVDENAYNGDQLLCLVDRRSWSSAATLVDTARYGIVIGSNYRNHNKHDKWHFVSWNWSGDAYAVIHQYPEENKCPIIGYRKIPIV